MLVFAVGNSPMQRTIGDGLGFVGLGQMGSPIAGRLIAAGYELVVYDPKPETVDVLGFGAVPGKSASEIAAKCGIVFGCLPSVE